MGNANRIIMGTNTPTALWCAYVIASSDESNTPPESRHDSEGVSIRPNEDEGDDADFAAEPAILDTTEGQDNFLTARTSKNDSEEELLSQPDNGDSLFLSQVGKSGGSDSDRSATDISKTQQYPLPTSALTNTSRQSFSSYEDANDDDSTDCPDQNCDALSPLPETAENGDSGEDDPDSRSDNEAAQKFPSMKSVFEDNANYHEDRIMLDNANGTENACPASSVDPSKLRETTSEKDGSDKSVSGDPSDNEATQNFSLTKPLKIDETFKNDEDDEAYKAETQIDDTRMTCTKPDRRYCRSCQSNCWRNLPTLKRQEVWMKQSLMHMRCQGMLEKINYSCRHR